MEKIAIVKLLDKVMHPAINHSLIELGILTNIEVNGDIVKAVFAFPFPNIPIAEKLFLAVMQPLNDIDLELDFTVRDMTQTEKESFLKMEKAAWKGL